MLFEENHVLDDENKRLLRLYKSEKKRASSGGKHDSSTKTKVRLIRFWPLTIEGRTIRTHIEASNLII